MQPNQDELKITLVLKLAGRLVTETNPVSIHEVHDWTASADPSDVDRALEGLIRDEDAPVEQDRGVDCIWIRDLSEAVAYIRTNGTSHPWGVEERSPRLQR